MEKMIFHNGALDEVNGKLIQMGSKCKKCGKVSYPSPEMCIFCAADELERVPLSTIGTVYSYSVTRVPVGPYQPPFISAYIDLPENVRVFGQIHADASEVFVGMKVKVETGIIYQEKDGTDVYGYYYVSAEKREDL